MTPIGEIAVPICADLFAAETGVALGRLGAEIILSPAAGAMPPDFDELATLIANTKLFRVLNDQSNQTALAGHHERVDRRLCPR